jgi:nucleoside-diphosphate-sugar epimerase
MKILVTGAAGFIGSNLCSALISQGHTVVGVDNLLTGRLANLQAELKHDHLTFIECDTRELPSMRFDAVFHLASPASPVGYGQYPIETLLANSEGTRRVLDVAVESGAKFLLSSTSEIYGDPLEHPQHEDYWGNVDPIGPRSCYDEGKRYAEALVTWYGRTYGLDERIIRIFNCYGPRNQLDDGRMVPTFIKQALSGHPMSVYGDGSQTRSLCFVDDIVAGLEAALFTSGTAGRIYNLGNPEEHTVLQYATLIKEMTQSRSEIVHLEGREGEIARRKPDIARAQRELGWEPRVTLPEGLAATIRWSREQLEPSEDRLAYDPHETSTLPLYLRAPTRVTQL